MKITQISNGITMTEHNGSTYMTEREIGEVGDTLRWSLTDGARWINDRTGDDVRESFIYGEGESEYMELSNVFDGEEAE